MNDVTRDEFKSELQHAVDQLDQRINSTIDSAIDKVRVETQREHAASLRTMIVLIVTIWAVTLATASALIILTR